MQNGFLAGTDAQKVEDLHYMYGNSEVSAILCARGGYGATRILEKPEALINYSKSLISELPENYSHSTTEVEVRKVNNSTWLLVSTFYRYNTNGDMFQSGTTQNFYIETNDGWKIFLRQSAAL